MGAQSNRHQKRSRASDAAEKVPQLSDDRTKRRRTSEGHEVQESSVKDSSSATKKVAKRVRKSDASSNGVGEKRNGQAPWSFSRPVGGRYSNLDPVVTEDEAYDMKSCSLPQELPWL